jgi:predicted Fe-Mo cluster-binding NifX family protein
MPQTWWKYNSINKGDKVRIAVASDDGVSIAGHFGRCAGFLIFDAEKENVKKIDYRVNSFGHHQQGQPEHNHEHGHDHGEGQHSHDGFANALADCKVVICRGMGKRAVVDLSSKGIQPAIVAEDISAQRAAELYAEGNLNSSSDSSCCSH